MISRLALIHTSKPPMPSSTGLPCQDFMDLVKYRSLKGLIVKALDDKCFTNERNSFAHTSFSFIFPQL